MVVSTPAAGTVNATLSAGYDSSKLSPWATLNS